MQAFDTVALTAGVDCWAIGVTGGDKLQIQINGGGPHGEVSLADLRAAHEAFFPKADGQRADARHLMLDLLLRLRSNGERGPLQRRLRGRGVHR